MSPGEVASANLLDNDGNALGLLHGSKKNIIHLFIQLESAYRDDTIVKDTEGYPQANQRKNDRYLDAAEMIQLTSSHC